MNDVASSAPRAVLREWLSLGWKAFFAEDHARAESCFDRAVLADPSPVSLLETARMLLLGNRLGKARSAALAGWERAKQQGRAAQRAEGCRVLAEIHSRLGDELAARQFRQLETAARLDASQTDLELEQMALAAIDFCRRRKYRSALARLAAAAQLANDCGAPERGEHFRSVAARLRRALRFRDSDPLLN